MSVQAQFDKAVIDSKKLTSKPSNEDLLELYGLFKVAGGENFADAKAPGAFDFKGKYKYNAWKDLVEKGTTPEQAKEQYVALVESLKEKYGYDENKEPEAVGN